MAGFTMATGPRIGRFAGKALKTAAPQPVIGSLMAVAKARTSKHHKKKSKKK